MRFLVRHATTYRYSAPVRLGDHLLRLSPLPGRVAALDHAIAVEPAPAWRRDEADGFGTAVTRLGFAGETDSLRIVSRIACDTGPAPGPLPALPPLPWPATDPALAPYLGGAEHSSVHAFAQALAAEAGGAPERFLDRLSRALYDRTNRHIRPEGHAQDAAHTLASGAGACRDLTVLFMAACRSLGIPARFTSGYQARAETPDGRRHLHAWPEVLLPGAGWRGWDPTHGVRVGDGHLALAAAPDQAATMPVEGGFWGTGIGSTLAYELEISASEG